MKVTRNRLRRLIKESIRDFMKSDFIGTKTGESLIPQQAYIEIGNWFKNNQDIVNKLKNFKRDMSSMSKNDPYDPFKNVISKASNMAIRGETQDVIPGGLNYEDIEWVRAQYITFIGDILLKNKEKLKSALMKGPVRDQGYDRYMADLNQLDLLFESMFSQFDEVGIGPVTYQDYIKSKSMLSDTEGNTLGNTLSVSFDESPAEYIPTMKALNRDNTDSPLSKSFNMTNQLRNIKVTNGLTLASVIVSFDYMADEEDIGFYEEDDILEQVREILFSHLSSGNLFEFLNVGLANSTPRKILAYEDIETEYGAGIKLLILSDVTDLTMIKSIIENIRESASGIGQSYADVPIEYRVEETITHIKPNSMGSAIDFITNNYQRKIGIPTNSNSAKGIIRQHKDFLRNTLDYFNNPQMCLEPDLGERNLDLIFETLENMGHNYTLID